MYAYTFYGAAQPYNIPIESGNIGEHSSANERTTDSKCTRVCKMYTLEKWQLIEQINNIFVWECDAVWRVCLCVCV